MGRLVPNTRNGALDVPPGQLLAGLH